MIFLRYGLCFVFLATPGAATRPAETRAAAKVTIENFRFSPANLTVPVGATVTWVNSDDVPHTATGKLSKLTLRERFKDYRLPA